MAIYWYKYCPVCQDGVLEIWEDLTNNRLYLQCGECTWSWLDPRKCVNQSDGFLAVLADFDTEPADLEQIKKHGWVQYAQGSHSPSPKVEPHSG
jgi:hypothetical protein